MLNVSFLVNSSKCFEEGKIKAVSVGVANTLSVTCESPLVCITLHILLFMQNVLPSLFSANSLLESLQPLFPIHLHLDIEALGIEVAMLGEKLVCRTVAPLKAVLISVKSQKWFELTFKSQ